MSGGDLTPDTLTQEHPEDLYLRPGGVGQALQSVLSSLKLIPLFTETPHYPVSSPTFPGLINLELLDGGGCRETPAHCPVPGKAGPSQFFKGALISQGSPGPWRGSLPPAILSSFTHFDGLAEGRAGGRGLSATMSLGDLENTPLAQKP